MSANNDATVMTEEQLREGFEAWCKSRGLCTFRTFDEWSQRKEYYERIELAFVAWQAAIAYLRTHSPEAAEIERLKTSLAEANAVAAGYDQTIDVQADEVERLKADNAQWADALVDSDAEHDRLSAEISQLTRELADVSISCAEWQQLASDLKLVVEAHTDLQVLEAEFGESHGQ